MYAGEKDVDHLSKDLSVKDLEKLIRHFSSLSKKNDVPTSCHVEPYSGNHALPEHLIKLGTQFIGYRDAAEDMRENLDRDEKRAEELAAKLEQREKAREKAERQAATVEDLRQRLHRAENALSDKIPIAPEHFQNTSDGNPEERNYSIPVESRTEDDIDPEDEDNDPMNLEALSIYPKSLADDTSDTAESIHDDDSDPAFIDAAVENANVQPSKRSSGGFADEDDLFDL
ncbi:hypothetical protein QYE76_015982 [Lolium multiflorum]|uniref:Uncharacterized protein n=1 Tax=Lolium multiflorum TaxID=4521 RepID=A0AAD8U7V9_LOLMU|nr:hypothetical protein QYE76_015982 [Lolium multiflorum]